MGLSQSTRFLSRVNEIGERSYGLGVLSIGWEFSVLVGRKGGLSDDALHGGTFLIPRAAKEFAKPIDEVDLPTKLIRRTGASSIAVELRDIPNALGSVMVNGALVRVDALLGETLESKWLDDYGQLQWSDDYVLFPTPIVVIVNTTSYVYQEIFQTFSEHSAYSCLDETRRFNMSTFERARALAGKARGGGISVIEVTDIWKDAFRSVTAKQGSPSDKIAEAVREELLN
ncbi:hypothetical protein NKH10_32285 [Mesorhizobium sp. M1340]